MKKKNDPFKVSTGGMADMKAIKAGKSNSSVDDAYETGIGTQFSVETNTRDEDAEMYVKHAYDYVKVNYTFYF